MNRRRRWALRGAYASLAVAMACLLVPPFYMLVLSFKTNVELSAQAGNPFWFQRPPTLRHYVDLLWATPFLRQLWNTVWVATLSVTVSMLVSIPAAYALVRLRFPGADALAIGVFCTYLVPETLLFLPLFKLVGTLGLLDSNLSLVLVFPTLAVPFCTWVLVGYFGTIPRELDEAALVDGASHLQMLVSVFLPVALPGLIAAGIFAFTMAWSNLLYPLAFIYSSTETVLTVGTLTLGRSQLQMAGALLAAAPPVVLFAFLMDYYVAGLTSGTIR